MEEVSQIGWHMYYFIPEALKGISDKIHRTKLKKMKKLAYQNELTGNNYYK